jgi:cell division protein FtsQ
LPLISGPDGYHEQMVDKYYTLQKQLELFALNLQKLSLDDRRAWSLELDNGLVILLGRKNFRERFNRFITLVPLYLNRKIDKAEQIDMRYPNGFAVKWKSGNPTLNAGSGAL